MGLPTTNFFSLANEGFIATTSGSILSGAATVPLSTVSGLTNASVFVGIIEPGGTKQQVFTGVVDTAGLQITSVVWVRGSNVDHAAGVSIVDYVTGTHHNMTTTGLLKEHGQAGAHLFPATDIRHATTLLSGSFTAAANTSEQTVTGLTTTVTDPGYDYVVDAVASLNVLAWPTTGNTNINLKINGTIVNQIYQAGSVTGPSGSLSGQLAVSTGANAVVTVTVSNDNSAQISIGGSNNRSNVKMLVFSQ